MNCSIRQSSVMLCGPSPYIQIRAQLGSEVVISTLGLSLQSVPLSISAESSLSVKLSLFTITLKHTD